MIPQTKLEGADQQFFVVSKKIEKTHGLFVAVRGRPRRWHPYNSWAPLENFLRFTLYQVGNTKFWSKSTRNFAEMPTTPLCIVSKVGLGW